MWLRKGTLCGNQLIWQWDRNMPRKYRDSWWLDDITLANVDPDICSNMSRPLGSKVNNNRSYAPQPFVIGIHRWRADSPHKGPVMRQMFPIDNVFMITLCFVTPSACIIHSIVSIISMRTPENHAFYNLRRHITKCSLMSYTDVHIHAKTNVGCTWDGHLCCDLLPTRKAFIFVIIITGMYIWRKGLLKWLMHLRATYVVIA